MIENEKQYKVTRAHLREFEATLDERRAMPVPEEVDEGMWRLEQEALESQIEEFRAELEVFERLKSGEVQAAALTSLDDLATLFIQARIAQGLTQRELAERLNVKEQTGAKRRGEPLRDGEPEPPQTFGRGVGARVRRASEVAGETVRHR